MRATLSLLTWSSGLTLAAVVLAAAAAMRLLLSWRTEHRSS